MARCGVKDAERPTGCGYNARNASDLLNHQRNEHPAGAAPSDSDSDETKAGTCQWHNAQGVVCGHTGTNKEVTGHRKASGHVLGLVYADLGGADMAAILATLDEQAIIAGHVNKAGTPRRGTFARELLAAALHHEGTLATILAQRDAAARHGGGNGVVTSLKGQVAAANERAGALADELAALKAKILAEHGIAL